MATLSRLVRALASSVEEIIVLRRLVDRLRLQFGAVPTPEAYPTDLNIELTSYCNSHCRFCTHEELVGSGKKPQRHMEFSLVETTVERLAALTAGQGVADSQVHFSVVGLGEPLLYPRLAEAVACVRRRFPRARISGNTNCIALQGKIAAELIGGELDSLILSLGFNEAGEYRDWFRTDRFEQVQRNVREFLAAKGEQSPAVSLHLFDKGLTTAKYVRFLREWRPLLGSRDRTHIEPYIPLVEGHGRARPKHPCAQLWSTLMVDCEGYLFPCCLGVWTKRDEGICLGHVTDQPQGWLDKVRRLRQRHLVGDFGSCRGCTYLTTYDPFLANFHRQIRRTGKEWLGLQGQGPAGAP